jgi:amino acid transporter
MITLVLSIVFIVGIPAARKVRGLPFASAADVFGSYQNFSDWDQGVSVCLTFLSSAWVISAWALPAYCAEGTRDASRATPKAITSSYVLMALLGLVICIMCAFCQPDMAAAAADES